MANRAQLVRWGNSHAVRIPKSVLQQMRIREGEELDIKVEHGRITLEPTRTELTLDSLVSGITKKNRHSEQDWDKAIGREAW